MPNNPFLRRPNPPYAISTRQFFNNTPCWNWICSIRGNYGIYSYRIGHKYSSMQAHRFIWQKLRGELSSDQKLDHLCKNTLCVNPDHLEIVTQQINTQRKINVKFTEADIRIIKALLKIGSYDIDRVSSLFKTSSKYIRQILRRKVWSNVY